jgi:hypothetical protein
LPSWLLGKATRAMILITQKHAGPSQSGEAGSADFPTDGTVMIARPRTGHSRLERDGNVDSDGARSNPAGDRDAVIAAPAGRAGDQPAPRSSLGSRTTHTLVAGYRGSPPAEQAAFGMVCSFTVTVATSRLINYIRERSRAMPRTRSVIRRIGHAPRSDSVRVHHFLPGVGMGFAAGGTAILVHPSRATRALSLPFGVGVALAVDELPLMAGRNNPYWGKERFAGVLCLVGAVVAAGISAEFVRRGRDQHDRSHRTNSDPSGTEGGGLD